MVKLDLINIKFGRLIVLSNLESDKWGNSRWLCKCECGKEIITTGPRLKSGHTKSCGCFQIEKALLNNGSSAIHGKCRTPIYNTWDGMKARCLNPNSPYYKNYGGRGIQVCQRWLKFENFLEDMGERPEGKTLERVDNNKGYFKDNCKWAEGIEQANNKRNNRLITFKGETKNLGQWSKELGLGHRIISARLKRGYSPALFVATEKIPVIGAPDEDHISTSYVERQNLTMRMGMRRFTRLTNGFSKKIENHEAAVALHFMHYNFARIHQTLRVTPAMQAGIADHVWSFAEIVRLADAKRLKLAA